MALIDAPVPSIQRTRGLGNRAAAIAAERNSLLIAFWLFGLFAAPIAARAWIAWQWAPVALLMCAVTWPLLWVGSHHVRRPATPPVIRVCVAIATLFATLSIATSKAPVISIGYLAVTAAAIYVCRRMCVGDTYRQLTAILRRYSVIMFPPMISLCLYAHGTSRNFSVDSAELNPNALAVTAYSVALAALSHRSLASKVVLAAPAIYLIYLAQSRTNTVAFAVAVGIAGLFWIRRTRGIKRAAAVLGGIALAILMLSRSATIVRSISDVLMLTDEHRGLASGASGRFVAWRETFDLFLSSPITGVGFRAHEVAMSSATSSHSGYLALLAEIGIFGFVATLLLIAVALRDFISGQANHSGVHKGVLVGFLVGYLLIGVFERYLINIGNPTSMLFILALGHRYWSAKPTKGSTPGTGDL